MENEKVQKEQLEEEPKKSNKNAILYGVIIPLIIVFLVAIRLVLIAPFSDRDLHCQYSAKFNKLTCTQIGDIVPKWLDTNDSSIFGSKYSMKLVIKNKDGNYKTLDMTDSVFIPDLQRKFIYELKEQTIWDYLNFKKDLATSSRYNWGSVALYCSENNLKEQVCKDMKKYNK